MQTQKCLPPSLLPTISPLVSLIPASTMYHSGSQWQSPGINQSRTQVASWTGNFVLDGCGCGECIQQQHGLDPPSPLSCQGGNEGASVNNVLCWLYTTTTATTSSWWMHSTTAQQIWLPPCRFSCQGRNEHALSIVDHHHHHNMFLKTNINTINKKPKSVLSKLNSDEILQPALLFQLPLQPDTTQITTTMILLASCFLPCIKKGKCSMNSSWVLFLGGSSDCCVLNGCTTNQHLCHSPAGSRVYYQECCATLLAPASGCVASSYNSQNYYWHLDPDTSDCNCFNYIST